MSTETLPLTFIFNMKHFLRFLLPILFVSTILTSSITALAHSGRTDSKGGHHSGDTYHYHHGYSAHDHYDMDGDGAIDCPYNFVDNVDHNYPGNPNNMLPSSKPSSTDASVKPAYSEAKAPVGSLTIAAVVVLALVIAPRYIFDDIGKTSRGDKVLSFICSLLPHAVAFLVAFLAKGGIHWAVLSNDDIVMAFIAAAGLSFAIASIAYFISFFISMFMEKLFRNNNILPSYLDSLAFSFALILFIQLIK